MGRDDVSRSNGNSFPKWALGILSAILLMLGGFWSVGTLKAYAATTRLDGQDQRLERIEEKLDRLLERRSR